MKNLLLIICLSAFSFCSMNAQENAPVEDLKETAKEESQTSFYENEDGEIVETSKPIFQFEEESHDFGQIPEGDKHAYEFKFTNVGSEPLIIKGVKASCGCTTPIWPKEPIMPGADATIKTVYNTKGRPGKFNKAVTITSNAVTPTKRLYIKGEVIRETIEKEEVAPVKKKSLMDEPSDN